MIVDLEDNNSDKVDTEKSVGLMCSVANDDVYINRWGKKKYEELLTKYNLAGIWLNDPDILPCSVYLRHCVLAAKTVGESCLQSFLDETFLVDRKTTIRQYLEMHPEVMEELPPESLIGRYSG